MSLRYIVSSYFEVVILNIQAYATCRRKMSIVCVKLIFRCRMDNRRKNRYNLNARLVSDLLEHLSACLSVITKYLKLSEIRRLPIVLSHCKLNPALSGKSRNFDLF